MDNFRVVLHMLLWSPVGWFILIFLGVVITGIVYQKGMLYNIPGWLFLVVVIVFGASLWIFSNYAQYIFPLFFLLMGMYGSGYFIALAELNASKKKVWHLALADDDEPFLRTRADTLRTRQQNIVVYTYASGSQLLSAVQDGAKFDLYFIDLTTAGKGDYDGIQCTKKILELDPEANVIGMSAILKTELPEVAKNLEELFRRNGANGFINKHDGVEVMLPFLE